MIFKKKRRKNIRGMMSPIIHLVSRMRKNSAASSLSQSLLDTSVDLSRYHRDRRGAVSAVVFTSERFSWMNIEHHIFHFFLYGCFLSQLFLISGRNGFTPVEKTAEIDNKLRTINYSCSTATIALVVNVMFRQRRFRIYRTFFP